MLIYVVFLFYTRLQEWNDEFYSCVSLPIAIEQLQMPASTVQDLYSYWLLKRKVCIFNAGS